MQWFSTSLPSEKCCWCCCCYWRNLWKGVIANWSTVKVWACVAVPTADIWNSHISYVERGGLTSICCDWTHNHTHTHTKWYPVSHYYQSLCCSCIRTDPFAPSCRGKPVPALIGSTFYCLHYTCPPLVSWVVYSIISTERELRSKCIHFLFLHVFFFLSLYGSCFYFVDFCFLINVWFINLILIQAHVPVFVAHHLEFPLFLSLVLA